MGQGGVWFVLLRQRRGGKNLCIAQGRITPCPKNCSPSSRVETGTNLGRAFPLQERDTPEAARVRSKGGTNINQSKRKNDEDRIETGSKRQG